MYIDLLGKCFVADGVDPGVEKSKRGFAGTKTLVVQLSDHASEYGSGNTIFTVSA